MAEWMRGQRAALISSLKAAGSNPSVRRLTGFDGDFIINYYNKQKENNEVLKKEKNWWSHLSAAEAGSIIAGLDKINMSLRRKVKQLPSLYKLITSPYRLE